VHELLADRKEGTPLFAAMLLARGTGPLVTIWCDPTHQLYPPALTRHGIDLKRLYLLRAKPADLTWAITECLRCKGVGAVVAPVQKLSRLEARRLQLAAEQGGGAGILLRTTGPGSDIYAATTRWLVRPAPGERTIQRWTVQLIHGHGGRIGKTVTLECSRENYLVRASEQLADRPGAEEPARKPVVARAG
jgi:protein ImuA